MKAIAAVDENWGIGNKGQLLISIPEDMKLFRSETQNKVVVMGRKTLESFPGGRPLKNRTNVVITTDKNYTKEGVVVFHNIEDTVEYLKQYNTDEIYIIGGGTIYEAMLKYCDTAIITKISKNFEADTYFPNLDKLEEWKETESSEVFEHEGISYRFTRFSRV